MLVIDDEPVVRDGRAPRARGAAACAWRPRTTPRRASAIRRWRTAASCSATSCCPTARASRCCASSPRRRPDLPVVLITGYATPDHAARAREAGAAAFLAKPFEARELLDCVRQALAGRAAAEGGRRMTRPDRRPDVRRLRRGWTSLVRTATRSGSTSGARGASARPRSTRRCGSTSPTRRRVSSASRCRTPKARILAVDDEPVILDGSARSWCSTASASTPSRTGRRRSGWCSATTTTSCSPT